MNSGIEKAVGTRGGDSKTAKRLFGAAAILVATVELVLCFRGPIAFVQRPSLVVFPVLSVGLSEEEATQVTAFVEQRLALIGCYAVASRNVLEEHITRTRPEQARRPLEPVGFTEAQKIAGELAMHRFAIATVFGGRVGNGIYPYVFSAQAGDVREIKRGKILVNY